jgi:RimJ/RimL family protein N-acetyltransferase
MEVIMEQIIGSHIVLRKLHYRYIPLYLDAFVDEIKKTLHVSGRDTEYTYLLQRLSLVDIEQTFFFIIFHKQNNNCIGAIEIRGAEHLGQLYCWLHPSYWGRNYFQEAMMLASRIYFSITNALYFTARVDIDNIRSYKALKKIGFADYHCVNGPHGKQYELILRKK